MGDFGHRFVCRMCFSVRDRAQSASFRRMHFSSPEQTWRRLTKKRSLHVEHNGKAQSVVAASPKGVVWSPQVGQNAVFREAKLKPRSADPGTTRPAGWRGVARAHLPSWAIFHSAPQPGGRLPRTSRAPQRDGKAHSAPHVSVVPCGATSCGFCHEMCRWRTVVSPLGTRLGLAVESVAAIFTAHT